MGPTLLPTLPPPLPRQHLPTLLPTLPLPHLPMLLQKQNARILKTTRGAETKSTRMEPHVGLTRKTETVMLCMSRAQNVSSSIKNNVIRKYMKEVILMERNAYIRNGRRSVSCTLSKQVENFATRPALRNCK